jgi:hypothetical protein
LKIGDIEFEAFPVEHSLIAPAVGYGSRLTAPLYFTCQTWYPFTSGTRLCQEFSYILAMARRLFDRSCDAELKCGSGTHPFATSWIGAAKRAYRRP